jgi:hypothetical protein
MPRGGEPPAPLLIECEFVGDCAVCGRPTCWRGATFDIHICSAKCYAEAREVLEAKSVHKEPC